MGDVGSGERPEGDTQMSSTATKTQLLNALAKAGLFTPSANRWENETVIQGKGTDFTCDTKSPAVRDFLTAAGFSVRSVWDRSTESWRTAGATYGSRVSQATRDLISANID